MKKSHIFTLLIVSMFLTIGCFGCGEHYANFKVNEKFRSFSTSSCFTRSYYYIDNRRYYYYSLTYFDDRDYPSRNSLTIKIPESSGTVGVDSIIYVNSEHPARSFNVTYSNDTGTEYELISGQFMSFSLSVTHWDNNSDEDAVFEFFFEDDEEDDYDNGDGELDGEGTFNGYLYNGAGTVNVTNGSFESCVEY